MPDGEIRIKSLTHATATFYRNSYEISNIRKDTQMWNVELHVHIQLALVLILWSRCLNGCL